MPWRLALDDRVRMLPLSDGIPARRFPIVTVAIVVANFAVWLLYELPDLDHAVAQASFFPCTVNGSCAGPEPWGDQLGQAMFMHGSWGHILGNMLFLAVFGKNVEDAFGRLRYLVFYFAGGFVAIMTQTVATLAAGSPGDARVPTLGASGAIAAVLGAYFVFYPGTTVRGLVGVSPSASPPGSTSASGSSTSSSKPTSACSAHPRTGAAWPSSPTSGASSSAQRSDHARPLTRPRSAPVMPGCSASVGACEAGVCSTKLTSETRSKATPGRWTTRSPRRPKDT
jgi:membrane associated rhomboid family serine protease